MALAAAGVLLCIVLVLVGIFGRNVAALKASLQFSPVVLAGLVLSFIALERAFITRDFSIRFVAEHGSSRTPALFNFTALWAGLEGSILLWALILAGFLTIFAWRFRHRVMSVAASQPPSTPDTSAAWAFLVLCLVTAFFIGLLVGPADPFLSFSPPLSYDGPGPDPLLQSNILMAFHPPLLYLGYTGFTVPFAFAVGALVSGRLDRRWLKDCRRFTLLSWGFLTIGIVLGAWWSYDTLGWGGYWGWDPVENASLLPWLCGTAFLHSAMAQESRGILVIWNLSLIFAAFNLTILGTFLTRSGVLVSVHSFTESSIGPALLVFFGISCATCIGLVAWRATSITSGRRIQSPINRVGTLIANNFLFTAFTVVVLLGTMFPLLSEALSGDQVSVGAPYFRQMTTPLGLLLLFLMAVSPLLPRANTNENVSVAELGQRLHMSAWAGVLVLVVLVLLGVRGWAPLTAFALASMVIVTSLRQLVKTCSRRGIKGGIKGLKGRSGGGMVAHIGLGVMALALAASGNFLQQGELSLRVGESGRVAGQQLEVVEILSVPHSERLEQRVVVKLGGRTLNPAVDRFFARGRIVGNPDTATSLVRDVQVSIVNLPEELSEAEQNSQNQDGADFSPDSVVDGVTDRFDGGAADRVTDKVTLRVTVQPMVVWLWIGGAVMAVGVVLCLWPTSRSRNFRGDIQQQATQRIKQHV